MHASASRDPSAEFQQSLLKLDWPAEVLGSPLADCTWATRVRTSPTVPFFAQTAAARVVAGHTRSTHWLRRQAHTTPRLTCM